MKRECTRLAIAGCLLGMILLRTVEHLYLTAHNDDPSLLEVIYNSSSGAALNAGRSTDIPYLREMRARNLHRSILQQQKFYAKKGLVALHYSPRNQLYATANWKFWNRWHALILNDEFAFRHIFKNGGTTLEIQTGSSHVQRRALGKRRMVATVRDPIDHFVSGWQECGERFPEFMEWEKTDDAQYDERIQKWLEITQTMAFQKDACVGRCACAMHSFPQGNFLMTHKGTIDPKVTLVGELVDLPDLLGLIGFEYNHSIGTGRNASATAFKAKHFPRKKHLMSNETMKKICDFVSLDYFLFDFQMPDACNV
eukprot:scaffold22611_cov153-Cylindrotheca_fusiformis.AAC.5